MDGKFSIVLVDDDIDDQELIKRAFLDSKVKVEINVMYNGLQLMDYLLRREAYKNVKDALPDLILLDLNMPLMDGFDVLATIKNTPSLRGIPIYVITTSRSTDDKKKALQLGAAGFYSKGASSKDIKKIVKEVCLQCFEE